ncbi:hypothetical protein LTR74_017169, partial [Friedmanniomyces endolithicus]
TARASMKSSASSRVNSLSSTLRGRQTRSSSRSRWYREVGGLRRGEKGPMERGRGILICRMGARGVSGLAVGAVIRGGAGWDFLVRLRGCRGGAGMRWKGESGRRWVEAGGG